MRCRGSIASLVSISSRVRRRCRRRSPGISRISTTPLTPTRRPVRHRGLLRNHRAPREPAARLSIAAPPLRPGGLLVLTMPNQESIRSYAGLIFAGHFTHFLGGCYPAHITALLRLDLTRLCAESGFTPPAFQFTDDGAIPKLARVHWQQVSFGLLRGRLFSDNVCMLTRATPPQPCLNRDLSCIHIDTRRRSLQNKSSPGSSRVYRGAGPSAEKLRSTPGVYRRRRRRSV